MTKDIEIELVVSRGLNDGKMGDGRWLQSAKTIIQEQSRLLTSCSLPIIGLLAYMGAFFSGKVDFSNGKDYSISGSITLEPTKKTMAVLPKD